MPLWRTGCLLFLPTIFARPRVPMFRRPWKPWMRPLMVLRCLAPVRSTGKPWRCGWSLPQGQLWCPGNLPSLLWLLDRSTLKTTLAVRGLRGNKPKQRCWSDEKHNCLSIWIWFSLWWCMVMMMIMMMMMMVMILYSWISMIIFHFGLYHHKATSHEAALPVLFLQELLVVVAAAAASSELGVGW